MTVTKTRNHAKHGVKPKTERPADFWNQFVRKPPEEEKKRHFQPSTELGLKVMQKNFERFCGLLKPKSPKHWLENLDMSFIEGFLRWYLETHNLSYQSGFLIRVRYWRIYYCEEMKKEFPYSLKKDMKSLVCQDLTEEFGLITTSKFQPSVNVDDLLYLTHHLMAVSDEYFPTPRQRQQHSTLRKMMTSTSARPGTLVESSGYFKSNDSLKWGDVDIFMVKVPDYLCKVLLVRSKHRLNKGKRNKGSAPIFTYTERNDNLGLCVVQDLLEYAFQDEIFASDRIKEPRDIWLYTDVPKHRLSVPIHVKKAMRDIPIFRPAVRNNEGNWVTHPTRALTYAQAAEDEKRVCRSAGLKELGSLYKYRKGAAAEIDKGTTEHKRNHIMGHTRGDVFRFYVNQIVDVDTQSMFLETPSKDALIKLSSNSGLTRDPSAPQHLDDEQKEAISKDPELLELKSQRDALRKHLVAQYGQIRLSQGTPEYSGYQIMQCRVRAKQKQLQKTALDQMYDDFFNDVGNQIIEANFQGKPVYFNSQNTTALPERRELADLEFKNRDASTVSDKELLEDRINSLKMRLDLYGIQVPRPLQKRIKTDKCAVDVEFPNPFPQRSASGLECPCCLGVTNYQPLVRQYKYARKDILIKHFQTHESGMDFSGGRFCDYPDCETKLRSLSIYKLHQIKVHGIHL